MNWLERARREIKESDRRATAISAERNPTAVMAVPNRDDLSASRLSIGSIGSSLTTQIPEIEAMWDEFEERAAIMEYDGGMSREEAERAAWELIARRYRYH